VLVFPEGRKGTEKLYKDRYKLRRFGRGGFVEAAMRAQVPIVPIAVVGAEESMPIFAQISALQKLTGLLYFPITPTFPHFGLLGFLGYLPAKFKIRFLEPIPTDQWGPEPVQGPRASSRASPTTSAPASRTSCTTCSPSARRSGSDEGPRHRRVELLGRQARRRRSSATRRSR
jgi:1-acyl-sn-glycerol-3-phosphate acyltransferase